MKVKALITWGAVCGFIIASTAMAESPSAERPGANPGGSATGEERPTSPRQPGHAPDNLRSFESIKLWRMTQALDLSEEQTAKIFPKLHQLQKERRQFRHNYRQMMQDLAALIRAPQIQENIIIKKMEEIEKAEQAFRERDRKGHEEIKTLLTPVQQAKLMLFQEKFDRDIRQILREMREQKGPLPSRRPPSPAPSEQSEE